MNFRPNFTKDNPETDDGKQRRRQYEPVLNYMAGDLVTFHLDQEIEVAIDTMIEQEISGAPVLNDNGELSGIITEQDCLRLLIDIAYHNQLLSKSKVKDYMTENPVTVSLDQDVLDVANLFLKTNFRRFPVVENGKLVGQVSRRDILRAAKEIESASWHP